MASKSKKIRLNQITETQKIKRIKYFSFILFLIKLLIIWRISNLQMFQVKGHIWLGADGENYLTGVDALVKDGLLSQASILNYWPAGYPLIIYLISFAFKSFGLTLLAILQSIIYSVASYVFVREIYQSRLKKYATTILFFLLFNPTLSLNSMAVGYESLCASIYLIIVTLILKNIRHENTGFKISLLFQISFLISLISFMQPRLLVSGFFIIFILLMFYAKSNFKKAIGISILSGLIIALLPVSLIVRNHLSTGVDAISTNLGVTMNIGAGNTTGGYVKNPPGVPCDINEADYSINALKAQTDTKKVKCVIAWYLNNPGKAVKLFYNKTIYFWSPWFGPEANGTMARNPWLTIHPLKNMTNTKEGIEILYGSIGKTFSWIWLLSGIFFLFYGFSLLWKQKFELRILGLIALAVVMSSWLVTLISIGDHRFRLPVMGMSIFLQVIGIRSLLTGGKLQIVQK